MNNIKFLNLYKTFEALVKEAFSGDKSRAIRVYISKLEHSVSLSEQIRGRKLNVARELRNGLAHLEDVEVDGLYNSSFSISDSLIETLEKEIEIIRNPKIVEHEMIKISNVFYTTKNELLSNVFERMSSHTYSNVPILEDGRVVGIFGEHSIFAFVADNRSFEMRKDLKIKDLEKYTYLDNQKNEYYTFVGRNEKVVELYDEFTKYKDGKRLGMAFVTQNGLPNERILGIVTIYDLIDKESRQLKK